MMVLCLVVLFFIGVTTWRYHVIKNIDFSYPKNVHYVFVGSSHARYAIDDSQMVSAVNCSRSAERYMYTYLKLRQILKYNPQIDTVFIQVSPTDLWQHTDDRYFDENVMVGFIPFYFPFFTEKEWEVYSTKKNSMLMQIMQHCLAKDLMNITKEAFQNIVPEYKKTMKMNPADVKPSRYNGRHGSHINYSYLRKIIEFCNEQRVKLIGICYPLYHQDYYYDLDYYYNVRETYFKDLEFYDYINFKVPDSCRVDAHHLNHRGAEVFTKEIMERFNIK